MPLLSIEELIERFLDFRAAFIIASRLSVTLRGAGAFEGHCRRRSGMPHALGRDEALGHSRSRSRRTAYKGFGVKRTSYRSSAERLIKRVLAGQSLPEINSLVDLYNMVSLETGLCLGCDDLDRTSGDLVFRFSKAGDSFVDMGARRRARIPTIRRRRARWSMRTAVTCSVAAGTGVRTRGPFRPSPPAGLCLRSNRTASATSKPRRRDWRS